MSARSFAFDAFVTAVLFERSGRAVFALGDGGVRFETGEMLDAHPGGSVLAACAHASGEGVVTGGDDGRLVWSRAEGAVELASVPGRWIDAVASSPESGLIALSAGKDVQVLDARDAKFRRLFSHERSVAGLAFDAKGRKLACATYGGAALWFARIEAQKPTFLKWAGSHVGVAFSPDSKFLISAMSENALHGWRLADAKDMRMGGYSAKPRAIAFLSRGALMATSGAAGAVLWPMAGANGPMGREAIEIGHDEAALVAQVAATPEGSWVAAGLNDGRVWLADMTATGVRRLKTDKGGPISALALTPTATRLAWGDEDGLAQVVDL